MKDFPMRYRDAYRVDLHVRMPLELYVTQRIRSISEHNSTVFLLNMLLDSESKLFLTSCGNQADLFLFSNNCNATEGG